MREEIGWKSMNTVKITPAGCVDGSEARSRYLLSPPRRGVYGDTRIAYRRGSVGRVNDKPVAIVPEDFLFGMPTFQESLRLCLTTQ